MRSQASSTRPEIAIATVSASTQVITRSGWREASSSTVYTPTAGASSGTASGRCRPAALGRAADAALGAEDRADRHHQQDHAAGHLERASDRCITRRKARRRTVKPSSTAKAMLARSSDPAPPPSVTLFMIGMIGCPAGRATSSSGRTRRAARSMGATEACSVACGHGARMDAPAAAPLGLARLVSGWRRISWPRLRSACQRLLARPCSSLVGPLRESRSWQRDRALQIEPPVEHADERLYVAMMLRCPANRALSEGAVVAPEHQLAAPSRSAAVCRPAMVTPARRSPRATKRNR